MVATITDEPISAQTVSQLTRELDGALRHFYATPLKDEWAYLLLDGESLLYGGPIRSFRGSTSNGATAPPGSTQAA